MSTQMMWTVGIGFVIGLVAKLFTPGTGPWGFILTVALGIAGAIGGRYVGQAVGWYEGGERASFIAAAIGAVALLVIYHLARSTRPS
jgi:uncharacterized membrane protein YeaQ/YmgE (transglycosylase-associated protein family)